MEDSCPATPPILTGRNSKSPLQIAISSPESDRMKSPSRDSPDSRCVICLGRLHNKSFTDSCLHQFCFQCLLQWSKVKPECPLCKQPFKSIIHNVRSNLDYDQYDIEHEEPHYGLSNLMHSYNFDLIPVDRRFRYRSTMTREYFRELAESFLAHTRRLPEGTFQIPPMIPLDSPLMHGVRHSSRLRNNTLRRERQRGTSDFRRNIYAQDLWVQDLVDISGRYRECTPQFYRENPAQIHRIIPWLNREVNVLLNDCESRAAYVLTRIVSSLTHHSIRSREFRELVYPYFGDRTDHFIHELYTFARSVYDITGFDQHAVYSPNPNYATEVQEILSSNEDSDIEVLEMVKNDKKTKKLSKQSYKKILLKGIEETHHVDEPVPGPSGIILGGNSESIELCESDSDDIKILDYVKPKPEIVTLSSEEESNLFSDPDHSVNKQDIEELCSSKISLKDDRALLDEKKKKKTGKGKCKSDGVGLKGKQKRKYIKSKKHRSYSTSSVSTASSDSSYSYSSSSSSSDSEGSRRHSSVFCDSDFSSDYQPSSKSKKKKSKVSRKKSKKKTKSVRRVTRKKGRRSSDRSYKNTEKNSGTKAKIKSCVVVPSSKSWETLDYSSRSSGGSDDRKFSDSSKSRASSSSRNNGSNTSSINSRKSRKDRDSSSEQGSGSKRKHKGGTSNERVKKKIKDLTESSSTDDCISKSSSVPSQGFANEELSASSGQSKVWDAEKLNQSLENSDTTSKSTQSTFSHSLSSTGSVDSFASKTNSVSSVNSD